MQEHGTRKFKSTVLIVSAWHAPQTKFDQTKILKETNEDICLRHGAHSGENIYKLFELRYLHVTCYS